MSKGSEPQTPGITAQSTIEEQISFVLGHPGMSAWLKSALSDALRCDPLSIMNDLEILNLVLRNRSELLIAEKLGSRNFR
jgi:hypothetical protein